ncbi:putative lsmAD [Lyophyllum shimeji]|uniref:LsmAD n=1 Tax=Lyophyllum shimeji TaxID=47721 RepID=A0A9P3PPV9_LYOSH|nr:putative lsmAD [Lyophyllum shimeji]
MSTAARQSKPARKGAPEPARRIPAWSGARASPTYIPPPNQPPRTQGSASPAGNLPSLAQPNGSRSDAAHDRVLQSLSGLTGTTVTISTKTSQRYEGVVASTSGEGDTTGVTLKDVKEISNPGAPLKDQLFVASTNIDTWTSGPADSKPPNGETFRTDADISHRKGGGRERELQQWSAGPDAAPLPDDDTFAQTNNTSWDQFAVNEKLFGLKTNYDENLYTTKLDRSKADFKERERQAQRIANEIIGAATNNPHIAEERGHSVDDSGANEEDKYGAVVRGTNAYVPPGARKQGVVSPPVNNAAAAAGEVPKVSINGPDGATLPSQTQSSSSSKAPSPAPTNKPPADPLPAFRDFVTNEKQRLTQKRQALVKSEMDKRMAELVKFSQSFKLNKPIPDDLVPILAKDEEKQRAIREKAAKDAASAQARAIGTPTPANAARGVQVAAAKISGAPQRPAVAPAAKTAANNVAPPQTAAVPKAAATTKPTTDTSVKKPAMVIQPIPPFRGNKTKNTPANGAPSSSSGATPSSSDSAQANNGNVSPASAANRLNVNASSFRPTAKAFTPGGISPSTAVPGSATASPKPKPETAPNPFFGTRPIKKSPPVNIKDDFNPFKHNKVVEPSQVSGLWPYSGKRYAQMFPQPPHQPQHPQPHAMPAPGPPPIPPPSYEEDSAAQAAARGYVYAYPYGYPGQPMMPGMAPPGPPGPYMPGPYMQPMQYPPGMPPPNAMYPPAMGQMPPQAYMPPPPGPPYPPPNGAGPRPSVPSTPMPAHVHQYYHQSPQLQHAVPYHMMMPPPPGTVPQHPYDSGPAPPVQMGGHA